jgi:hypothetical protein
MMLLTALYYDCDGTVRSAEEWVEYAIETRSRYNTKHPTNGGPPLWPQVRPRGSANNLTGRGFVRPHPDDSVTGLFRLTAEGREWCQQHLSKPWRLGDPVLF